MSSEQLTSDDGLALGLPGCRAGLGAAAEAV